MKYFPYDNTLISKDLGHKLAGKHKVFSYVSVTRQLVISGEGRLLPFPVWIVEKVPHTEGRRLRSEDEQRWLLSLWSISQWRQGALNSSTSKCCASLAKWPTREGDRRKDRERGERERDCSANKTGRGNFTHHFYCNLLQMFVAFGFVSLLLLLLLLFFTRVFLLFSSLLARLAFGLWQNLQLLAAAAAVAAAKFYLSQVASVAYIWQVNVVCGGQEKKPRPDAQPISSWKPKRKPTTTTTTRNKKPTTTKSSAGWRLQLGLIHCILLYVP